MINLTFEINGRRVDPNRIGDALERAVFQQVRDSIVKKLRDVRDPDTGKAPQVTVKGRSLDDLKIDVKGSDAVIAEVKRRLGS